MEADAVTNEVSRRKAEEEAADQKADETVAGAAEATQDDEFSEDECSDEEEDPEIRNLNLISKRNLMPPEWVENRRRRHYEQIEMYNRSCDALEDPDLQSDDEAGLAEYKEWSKKLWASVDLSPYRAVGRESRGEYPVAVLPEILLCRQKQDKDHDADAAAPPPAAAESSS